DDAGARAYLDGGLGHGAESPVDERALEPAELGVLQDLDGDPERGVAHLPFPWADPAIERPRLGDGPLDPDPLFARVWPDSGIGRRGERPEERVRELSNARFVNVADQGDRGAGAGVLSLHRLGEEQVAGRGWVGVRAEDRAGERVARGEERV